MIDKLTKLLNIEGKQNKIELLQVILELTVSQILAYINETSLPTSLEWIAIKVCQREFNMNGSSHIQSESIDVISTTYKTGDLLADYYKYLDLYIENVQQNKAESSVKKAKFY